MSAWRWIGAEVVLAIHDRQIAEHGGLDGIRDAGVLESALARPRSQAAYGPADAADLAAGYAHGLARNHGFADGNKRTAWIVARLFLADNGCRMVLDRIEAIRMMEAIAAGSVDEAALAAWFRKAIGGASSPE